MTSRRLFAVVAVALFALALAPACTSTARISDVYMSLDSDGARRRSEFYTDSKEINCVAEYGVGRDDVTIEMLIRYVQDFDGRDFRNINTVTNSLETHPQRTKDVPGKISLAIVPIDEKGQEQKDLPIPAGRAQCEVYLDGSLEKTVVYNVKFPPCPTTFIKAGAVCRGFYALGTNCPAAGASGDPTPTCSCEETGWKC
jgi:hypothetical protein